MSALHCSAFQRDRGWTASEFEDLLQSPFVQADVAPHGFALSRTLAGESELLTLAVDPDHHRQGIARKLMLCWLERIKGLTETAFLEVAADNYAALALYADFGFAKVAARPKYYARKDAPAVDAFILRRDLTLGHRADSVNG